MGSWSSDIFELTSKKSEETATDAENSKRRKFSATDINYMKSEETEMKADMCTTSNMSIHVQQFDEHCNNGCDKMVPLCRAPCKEVKFLQFNSAAINMNSQRGKE